MALLKWIEDERLEQIVTGILEKASEAKFTAESEFGKNVIDPFSAVFEIAGFEIEYKAWLKSEKTRQAQKTLQNHIGSFHQSVLGSVKGWTDKKTGEVIDLACRDKKIIAEVKNKHNTISGGKLADLYDLLNGQVMPKSSVYKGYTAYYVAIIPKKPKRYDKPFTPSDNKQGEKRSANEKIREIDGASFYTLVTGSETALEDLFQALPDVITKCSGHKIKEKEKLIEFYRSAFE